METGWEIKERICWVGDSITASGGWINNIWGYMLSKYPGKPLRFYNCGTPGDQTRDAINRFDTDINIHKPQQAIILLGMNDSGDVVYVETAPPNPDNIYYVLDQYISNMNRLLNMFEVNNVSCILCTPTPYDDTVLLNMPNNFGRNYVLGKMAQAVRDIGKDRCLPVVDFWKDMTEQNNRYQKIDPEFTLCGIDRIHPDSLGNCIMGYLFLKTMGVFDEDGTGFRQNRDLLNLIKKKHLLENNLRNMNMIWRARNEMNAWDISLEQFKKAYLESVEHTPYKEFCMSCFNLYETKYEDEMKIKNQVDELISDVINASQIHNKCV